MSRKPVHLGHDRSTPLILGDVNHDDARLVEGTGLFLAIRKGDRRWVTGSMVERGLRSGVLIAVATGDQPAMSSAQLRQAVDAELAERPLAATQPPVPADADLAALRAAPAAKKAPQAPKKAATEPVKAPAKKRAPRKRAPAKK